MKRLALLGAALALCGLLGAVLPPAQAGISGTLRVENVSKQSADVYINGKFVGTVPADGERSFFSGQQGTTYLYARGEDGQSWERKVEDNVKDFTWRLLP